jgi:hypothetical protein
MYLPELTSFYAAVEYDQRLTTSHIGLYMALFQLWNINQFKNPISFTRKKIMKACKISSISTYHRLINDLCSFGYIKYIPSFHPLKGSIAYLLKLKKA